jgi:hypothetical protein
MRASRPSRPSPPQCSYWPRRLRCPPRSFRAAPAPARVPRRCAAPADALIPAGAGCAAFPIAFRAEGQRMGGSGVEARFGGGGEPTPIGAEASGIVILVERGEEEEEETRWGADMRSPRPPQLFFHMWCQLGLSTNETH